jgi:hypothetical protein
MTCRILLPALLAPFLLHGGDSARERATIKGAKSVAVIVDALPDDLAKEDVSAGRLRDRLTGRLLDAGIPLDDASKDFVGLRVSSVRDKRGPYAVAITLGFYQPATLVRDPAVRIAPQTWDTGIVLMAAPKFLERAALESIDELADRFIAAWRSVNGSAAPK